MKEDQTLVRQILVDTVTLLCRNGFTFQRDLCIQGVIGITLDKSEAVIIHIDKTIERDVTVSDNEASDSSMCDNEARQVDTACRVSPSDRNKKSNNCINVRNNDSLNSTCADSETRASNNIPDSIDSPIRCEKSDEPTKKSGIDTGSKNCARNSSQRIETKTIDSANDAPVAPSTNALSIAGVNAGEQEIMVKFEISDGSINSIIIPSLEEQILVPSNKNSLPDSINSEVNTVRNSASICEVVGATDDDNDIAISEKVSFKVPASVSITSISSSNPDESDKKTDIDSSKNCSSIDRIACVTSEENDFTNICTISNVRHNVDASSSSAGLNPAECSADLNNIDIKHDIKMDCGVIKLEDSDDEDDDDVKYLNEMEEEPMWGEGSHDSFVYNHDRRKSAAFSQARNADNLINQRFKHSSQKPQTRDSHFLQSNFISPYAASSRQTSTSSSGEAGRFQCEYPGCGASFVHKQNLQRHQTYKHGRERTCRRSRRIPDTGYMPELGLDPNIYNDHESSSADDCYIDNYSHDNSNNSF